MFLKLEHTTNIFNLITDDSTQNFDFKLISNHFKFSIFMYDESTKYKIGQYLVELLFHHTILLPRMTHKIVALFCLSCVWDNRLDNPFNGIIYDLINLSSYKMNLIHLLNQNVQNKWMPRPLTMDTFVINSFPDLTIAAKNFVICLYTIDENDNMLTHICETVSPDCISRDNFSVDLQLLDTKLFKMKILHFENDLPSSRTSHTMNTLYKFSNCPLFTDYALDCLKPFDLLDECFQKSLLNDMNRTYGSQYKHNNLVPVPQYKQYTSMKFKHSSTQRNPPLARSSMEFQIEPSVKEPVVKIKPLIVSSPSAITDSVSDLLSVCTSCSLTPTQQETVIAEMKKRPVLALEFGLTPEKYPNLVENNPNIAHQVLNIYISLAQENDSPTMTTTLVNEYFCALTSMPTSLHSMEVVNRLSKLELPPEILHKYILNCMKSCENSDKYMQNRLVRLVCVFIQSLIRNNIFNIKNIYFELQAFCIKFSQIREATALFRLLKEPKFKFAIEGD